MQLSKIESVLIKYFEKEYGNSIDVYSIPGKFGSYYLVKHNEFNEIGRLSSVNIDDYHISYYDMKNRHIVSELFSIHTNDISEYFEKWILLKFKCNTIKEFKDNIDKKIGDIKHSYNV